MCPEGTFSRPKFKVEPIRKRSLGVMGNRRGWANRHLPLSGCDRIYLEVSLKGASLTDTAKCWLDVQQTRPNSGICQLLLSSSCMRSSFSSWKPFLSWSSSHQCQIYLEMHCKLEAGVVSVTGLNILVATKQL